MSESGVVAIVNQALALLAQDEIVSLDESSPAARRSATFWPQVRDTVFAAHLWSAVKEQAELARSATAPVTGFSYAYVMPNNPYCLKAWEMEGGPDVGEPWPWKVKGRTIETDAETAILTFSARITDTTRYDPPLVEALAAGLAWKLAYVLTGSKKKVPEMLGLFEGALARAKNSDGLSRREAPREQTSSYVKARW